MARRKKNKSLGFTKAVHQREAVKEAKLVQWQVKGFYRNLKEGNCLAALNKLTYANEEFGRVAAHSFSRGFHKKGTRQRSKLGALMQRMENTFAVKCIK